MVRPGKNHPAVGPPAFLSWTDAIFCYVDSLVRFYLHLTSYRPGMIDPHPIASSVIVGLDVARGPLELGAECVLTGRHILEKKPTRLIRFSRNGLATGQRR
jgi:hypothetical protein